VTRMAEQVAQENGLHRGRADLVPVRTLQPYGDAGTVVVPEETLLANMRAIITGLWNTGFRKQIFVNGHGQEEVPPPGAAPVGQEVPGTGDPDLVAHLDRDLPAHEGQGARGPVRYLVLARRRGGGLLFAGPIPEFMDMKLAVDNKPEGFLPPGHVDKAARCTMHRSRGMSMWAWVHRGQGLPRRGHRSSDAGQCGQGEARCGSLMDYMCKLIGDIMTRFPAGVLPPADKVSMRSQKEIDDLLKGPLNGGTSIYTIAYPP